MLGPHDEQAFEAAKTKDRQADGETRLTHSRVPAIGLNTASHPYGGKGAPDRGRCPAGWSPLTGRWLRYFALGCVLFVALATASWSCELASAAKKSLELQSLGIALQQAVKERETSLARLAAMGASGTQIVKLRRIGSPLPAD
jgi:hypothetical protein